MITTADDSQTIFYRGFLMARGHFNPRDFGVELDREHFMDEMVDEFAEACRDTWSIDELCLHPREALRFCDAVRHRKSYYDLPDDIILRSIMARRKNPA